jgi:5-(carboxyamino)imidazole ribonucleotide synthase
MKAPVVPPAWLGVLGGGQLGRFFTIAARQMGYRVAVLDPDAASPAGALADRHLVAAFDDALALDELAGCCAAVTVEFENVPAESLARLAGRTRVAPSPECIATAQDRIREKAALARHGLPLGPYAPVRHENDLRRPELYPGILKTARLGYDGKGQRRVGSLDEAVSAWRALGGVPCVLERRLDLDCELSAIVARAEGGELRAFPVAKNRHRHGILDISIVPAGVEKTLAERARMLAGRLAAGLGFVGVLAVEYFVVGGELFANEIAPRPHNSGHYTLDACASSQYEQQVRALCGLPLGEERLLAPAVMVNVLGDAWRGGEPRWEAVLADPGAKLYLYGKREPRPGRKMGHFTVLGESAEAALERALALQAKLVRADG